MSSPAPTPLHSIRDLRSEGLDPALLRRRAAAARVRRRRLLLADLAVGALIALIGILLAGLAIIVLIALLVLAACATWTTAGWARSRRTERRGGSR